MSYLSVDRMRLALGLPHGNDPEIDPLLDIAGETAQALVEGYIGTPLVAATQTEEFFYDRGCAENHVLATAPVQSITSVTRDGTLLVVDTDYVLEKKSGIVHLINCWCGALFDKTVIVYVAGYVPLPDDLDKAVLGIALNLYNAGGLGAAGGSGDTGALKSLTMFDAMSMSFDTGNSSATSGTLEGILGTWKFVLDKYRMAVPGFA